MGSEMCIRDSVVARSSAAQGMADRLNNLIKTNGYTSFDAIPYDGRTVVRDLRWFDVSLGLPTFVSAGNGC